MENMKSRAMNVPRSREGLDERECLFGLVRANTDEQTMLKVTMARLTFVEVDVTPRNIYFLIVLFSCIT